MLLIGMGLVAAVVLWALATLLGAVPTLVVVGLALVWMNKAARDA